MKIKAFLLFLILLGASYLAFAQSALDKLEQKLTTFQNIQADFRQIIRASDGMVLQASSGKMAIYRPGKFRWDVREPMQQLIVTDGKAVWIYEPDLRQVIVRPFDVRLGETPVMLLASPTVHISEKFLVEKMPSGVGTETFRLIPRGEEKLFEVIIITFKRDRLFSMTLMGQMGQRTELVFSNVVVNAITSAVLERLFSFQIPVGIDVVRS